MEATLGGNIARDAVEGDHARARLSFACDELFALDNLVPAAVAFINRGVGWRRDGLVIDDMRITHVFQDATLRLNGTIFLPQAQTRHPVKTGD